MFELVDRPRIHETRVYIDLAFYEIVGVELDGFGAFGRRNNGDCILFSLVWTIGIRDNHDRTATISVGVVDEYDRSLCVGHLRVLSEVGEVVSPLWILSKVVVTVLVGNRLPAYLPGELAFIVGFASEPP